MTDDICAYRQYIEEALEYASGSHTFDDIRRAVEDGRMQLWVGPTSVVITELLETPQHRVINFFLAGGGPGALSELEAMEQPILDWGRAQGCTRATFVGRRGWERTFLSRSGWQNTGMVVLEKSLDGQEGR